MPIQQLPIAPWRLASDAYPPIEASLRISPAGQNHHEHRNPSGQVPIGYPAGLGLQDHHIVVPHSPYLPEHGPRSPERVGCRSPFSALASQRTFRAGDDARRNRSLRQGLPAGKPVG